MNVVSRVLRAVWFPNVSCLIAKTHLPVRFREVQKILLPGGRVNQDWQGFDRPNLPETCDRNREDSSVTYSERIHLKAGTHRGIYEGCAPGASRFARRAKPTAYPKVERTSRSRAA